MPSSEIARHRKKVYLPKSEPEWEGADVDCGAPTRMQGQRLPLANEQGTFSATVFLGSVLIWNSAALFLILGFPAKSSF